MLYSLQTGIQRLLDANTEGNFVFADTKSEDGEALQKFSEFDTGVNIFCRFTGNRALCFLPRNAGCLFT